MSTILALDISGTPRMWISPDDAITYHAKGAVAWSLGEVVAKYRGGFQEDGTQSYIESPSIIAIRGKGFDVNKFRKVPLSNRGLFGRDRNICGYCGDRFDNYKELSRDHIMPVSRGGENTWMNTICACKRCNSLKGNRTLKESGLELLFLPYEPNHYEHMVLMNRNILADQMDFLAAGLPKHSRLRLN
jgi:5-methylcytosine-specific restriction endonuclease McrA